jgi:hypothetical protein
VHCSKCASQVAFNIAADQTVLFGWMALTRHVHITLLRLDHGCAMNAGPRARTTQRTTRRARTTATVRACGGAVAVCRVHRLVHGKRRWTRRWMSTHCSVTALSADVRIVNGVVRKHRPRRPIKRADFAAGFRLCLSLVPLKRS